MVFIAEKLAGKQRMGEKCQAARRVAASDEKETERVGLQSVICIAAFNQACISATAQMVFFQKCKVYDKHASSLTYQYTILFDHF